MFNFNSSMLHKTVVLLLFGYSLHAGAVITTSADNKQLTYRVPVNKSLLITLDQNVSKLTKGKDSIADMTLLSSRQLLLRGNEIGSTNATIWDDANKVNLVMNIEVTHNLDGLKQKLYELMPNEPIQVRAAEKCIILSGEISNLVNLDFAMKVAQGFVSGSAGSGNCGSGGATGGTSGSSGGSSNAASNSIVNMMHVGGEQQVMLEVKIAEVNRVLARKLTLKSGASNSTQKSDGSFLWTVAAGAAGAFSGDYMAGEALFSWTLDFSRNTSLATILAEPNLTTLSGKKASFLSGGEFPYTACTPGTNVISPCTVSFKQFGVGLEFTPIVLDSNRINLTTHVAVSALSNKANQILASDSGILQATPILQSTPSLDTREAVTTLELADGQTMSIAGLISENQSNKQDQTPGLADIPVLGSLFRNREASNDKKELVILITPHLARPIPPSQIKLPTDSYVAPNDIDFYLLGRMEARKTQTQITAVDPGTGGTTGQFGHQINDGAVK